jgi:RNA polymerase sigma-70 factor (ECF subfamily)
VVDHDDHALMMAVRAGDNGPLAVLFTRHHGSLFNYFRKFGYRRSDAEDLVQETFVRVLRYARSYDPQGHFPAWLYRIARNAARDTWHANQDAHSSEQDEDTLAPRQYEPAEIENSRHLEQALQRALLRLPREKRELILLSRVRELSANDLAALFDCNVNAIKVRLHRSLKQLQHYFEQASGDAPAQPLNRSAKTHVEMK